MGIAEDMTGLEAAKEKAEEAWNKASEAKELAAEAVDMILEVTGPNLPETLAQAYSMLQEAGGQIEQGQALLSTTQGRIEAYVTRLME